MTVRSLPCLSLLCAAALAFLSTAAAQQTSPANGQRITPNFKDAPIATIVETVSEVTGKNFIIDPRVNAQVTMFSRTPMSPDAFYEAFLAILQVHGFVAVPSGNIVKVMPDANARQMPSSDLPDRVSSTSDEIVTQVIAVKNVSAAQLVPILRPLIPQYGHLAAYPASNILIVSDRAANVNRIWRIIRRIDQAGDDEVEVVPLQNASAAEVVRIVNSLNQAQVAAEGAGAAGGLRLVADDRSNSVLISGESSRRLRTKALIAHLDTPRESGGDTQVRYLRYADAEKIAPKLKEQVTGIAQAAAPTGGGGGGGQGGPAAAPPTSVAAADRSTTIWADPETNALVITAQPKVMRQLNAVIDKLDIRRLQVLVEAIIVDVSLRKSAELGVNWAVFSDEDDTRIPAGAFIADVGGVNLIQLANAVDNPSAAGNLNLSGTTIGIGRIGAGKLNFAAMLRALRSDDDSNIIATPSALTMDNQEAEIKVAQEVPFVTGSFTNTGQGGGGDGGVNPFQTIQREEVGTILKITPQINEGDAVMLKIELESSDVIPANLGPAGAVDLTTNKRTITTNVLIEDGGIIVLGGLISENFNRQESRVPFLGRIPIIGHAFKVRSGRNDRTNLMVFIRPKILRDGVQSAIETGAKYNYIREEQRNVGRRELLPLIPGARKPLLPEPPPLPERTEETPQKFDEQPDSDESRDGERTPPQTPPQGEPSSTSPPEGAQ
jgi:general secretion pathway protein D